MNRQIARNALTVLVLLSLVFYFLGGSLLSIGVPIILFTILALSISSLLVKRRPSFNEGRHEIQKIPTDETLSRLTEKEVSEDMGSVQVVALGSAHRRGQWLAIESVVDEIIDKSIKLIASHVKDHHTIAVFFPTEDGGYKLRKYSSLSEHINKDAVIYPGVGVIGGFLKDGLKQLNLQEIMSDSMTLYYYNKDAGIRSLMASPIIAGDSERGTIIVDSTLKKNFTDEHHAYLSTMAAVLGQAVYYSYLHTEHKLEHLRLAAMSSIEKEFFRNLKIDAILDKMTEIIPFAITCNRLTISMRHEDGDAAKIVRTWGTHVEELIGKQFQLDSKSLASICFSKNICFYRNFSKEHYEVRFLAEEPQIEEFGSFLAVPIGVDTCKGMILVESFRREAFSESNRDLLSRIATSAGLAIEKLLLFERANAMATHDGLTGLNNHRQFQQVLKDEITRAIRYNEPLALVLCDIDFFKKCNDTYGHQFGDIVLKGVASKLETSIREGIDTAARYGGEEFALVLVKTDEKTARETVERIRQQIAALLFKGPASQDVHVTMSFGIAVYRQHAKQIDELIKKADKALYRAKENGRNRLEVF